MRWLWVAILPVTCCASADRMVDQAMAVAETATAVAPMLPGVGAPVAGLGGLVLAIGGIYKAIRSYQRHSAARMVRDETA